MEHKLTYNAQKWLDTRPLDRHFTAGECGVEAWTITGPRYDGTFDMAGLAWAIQGGVARRDTLAEDPLTLSDRKSTRLNSSHRL